ncbi:MAG: hypothetical protein QOK15_2217 [Nocardioidaceae bacterium]|nr:hypothetical protein [Nocardioidaceae bacterium]
MSYSASPPGDSEDPDVAGDLILVLAGGRRVQVWDGGDPAGRPVLFLPGCPDSRWAAWTGQPAARRTGVRLIAVNRPGYGASDAGASTHVGVADDLVAVADALDIGGFAVLGMSVGGVYAVACAALHPGRVRALATVSAPGEIVRMRPPYHRDGLSPEDQADVVALATLDADAAIERLRPGYAEFVAPLRPDDSDDAALADRWTAASAGVDGPDHDLVASWPTWQRARAAREALLCPEGYLRDAAAMFRPWEVDPAQVSCPTWVRHGTADVSASPRNARWLADHLPGARLALLQGVGHLAALHDAWDEILGDLGGALRDWDSLTRT